MRLITREDVVSKVAEKFRQQYQSGRGHWDIVKSFGKYTYAETYLLLLKATTSEEVDDVIGVKGWANCECHQCGKRDCDFVIEVGEALGHESMTACLCADCLSEAYRLARAHRDADNRARGSGEFARTNNGAGSKI